MPGYQMLFRGKHRLVYKHLFYSVILSIVISTALSLTLVLLSEETKPPTSHIANSVYYDEIVEMLGDGEVVLSSEDNARLDYLFKKNDEVMEEHIELLRKEDQIFSAHWLTRKTQLFQFMFLVFVCIFYAYFHLRHKRINRE